MKILGTSWNALLVGILFGITTVLFIKLPISSTNDATLGENFWQHRTPKGKKRKVKSESDWKKYYGSCPELKDDLKIFGKHNFKRKFYHYIVRRVNAIMKRPDNYSNTMYLRRQWKMEPRSTTTLTSLAGTCVKTIFRNMLD